VHTLYVDARLREEERRQRLYAGNICAFTPQQTTLALCDVARELIDEAFAPYDPLEAQYHMPADEWVARFAPAAMAFVHHSFTMQLVRDVLFDLGCDPAQTYVGAPRLQGTPSGGYLASRGGDGHRPRRDTWYSAPMAQLNWWLPVTPFDSQSALAFHPRYWSRSFRNGSPEAVELDNPAGVVCDVGGIVLFSAAQMHSTVPNTSGLTQFSIDFRTVNVFDLQNRRGAPNVDSAPRGTSLRDFVRCSDLAPLPDNVVAMYEAVAGSNGANGNGAGGVVVSGSQPVGAPHA
jgi:hypothetical protein